MRVLEDVSVGGYDGLPVAQTWVSAVAGVLDPGRPRNAAQAQIAVPKVPGGGVISWSGGEGPGAGFPGLEGNRDLAQHRASAASPRPIGGRIAAPG